MRAFVADLSVVVRPFARSGLTFFPLMRGMASCDVASRDLVSWGMARGAWVGTVLTLSRERIRRDGASKARIIPFGVPVVRRLCAAQLSANFGQERSPRFCRCA